jgi:hypothetical protein
VIASPDHGGGRGKAGVWCEALTRDDLFDAFHARHTFGTSGAKMSLFVSSDRHMMGDKALKPKSGGIPLRIRAVADRAVTRLVVFRNNEIVLDIAPHQESIDVKWTDKDPPETDPLWYYVRLHREDEELAWSSPIWFFETRKTLESTRADARTLPERYPNGVPCDDPEETEEAPSDRQTGTNP